MIEPDTLGYVLINSGFEPWFRYMFRVINNTPYDCEPLHKKLLDKIQDVIDGKTTRLNLNLCPRSGKCFGKGTLVRMYDGSIKKVEDIVIGDVVMGDDETPRHVLTLGRGQEEMFKITHEDGSFFVCNKSHLLVLRNTTNERNMTWGRTKRFYKGTENIISVGDYLNTTANFKKRNKAIKAKCDYYEKDLPLDPYLLGVWLGDGETCGARITNMDTEVIDYIYNWASKHNNRVGVAYQKNTKCNTYSLAANTKNDISFRILLKQIDVFGHKNIPHQYLTASRKQRLELLAGIIDTDGSCSGNNAVEIISVRKELANNYVELARSLGFRASVHIKHVNSKDYYRVYISGDLSCIPIKVKRKIKTKTNLNKINILYQSFKVESLGIGNYYGFTIDGNHKFLLGDYTVVHNTTVLTWLVVYALTKDPKSQIIYTSFNQELLTTVSQQIANIMQNPIYQAMYGQSFTQEDMETDPIDDFWKDYLQQTEKKIKFSSRKIVTPQGGVVLFNSIGAALTGFGVQRRGIKGFTGFLALDDADKPTDVRSQKIREKTHIYFQETLLSRLNNPDAPILNTQQRLHLDDLSGFLEKIYGFEVFKFPLLDSDGTCNLPKQYTPERIKELQVDNYTFSAQYQQEPIILGGGVFKEDYWKFYDDYSTISFQKLFITADTAMKTNEWNDFTVFTLWGKTGDDKLYLLDMIHDKFEAPELESTFLAFWNKWKNGLGNRRVSAVYIEDKASGIGLIQSVRRKGGIPIIPVKPDKDKYSRVMDIIGFVASGCIYLPPKNTSITRDFLSETSAFTADMSHAHDDVTDCLTMACHEAYLHRGLF